MECKNFNLRHCKWIFNFKNLEYAHAALCVIQISYQILQVGVTLVIATLRQQSFRLNYFHLYFVCHILFHASIEVSGTYNQRYVGNNDPINLWISDRPIAFQLQLPDGHECHCAVIVEMGFGIHETLSETNKLVQRPCPFQKREKRKLTKCLVALTCRRKVRSH